LLDKAEFPRDKPCGGGITVRALRLLPFSIESVVERVITDVYLTHKRGSGFSRRSDDHLMSMTQRRNFDMLLLEKALEAGVTLKERAPVRHVSRDATSVDISTDDETFTASVLVAADGANGKTAQMSGIEQNFWQQIALEGNITPLGGMPEEWQTCFGLDVGSVPGGYGWVFPKGDHLNVGIGGWRYVGPGLRNSLNNLAKFHGFESENMWGLRGHYLTIRKPDSPLVDGNVAALDQITLTGSRNGLDTLAEHEASRGRLQAAALVLLQGDLQGAAGARRRGQAAEWLAATDPEQADQLLEVALDEAASDQAWGLAMELLQLQLRLQLAAGGDGERPRLRLERLAARLDDAYTLLQLNPEGNPPPSLRSPREPGGHAAVGESTTAPSL
jgi:hypothetical protein